MIIKLAPQPQAYAVKRYDFEAWRHWNIETRHAFKAEVDDDARKSLFPQNARLTA